MYSLQQFGNLYANFQGKAVLLKKINYQLSFYILVELRQMQMFELESRSYDSQIAP